LVLLGSDEIALPAFAAARALPDTEVVAVYSQPDRPAGRGQEVRPNPVAAWARAEGLTLLQPEKLEAADAAHLVSLQADLGVVMAYGQLLKEEAYLVPGSGFWTVIDSAMLADDTVAYLFADAQGLVKFGGTDLARWQPLTGVFIEPLHVSTKPCLMPAGFDPRGAQFYLAFIAEGNRIERRKLGR
jgi:hypothetical protein